MRSVDGVLGCWYLSFMKLAKKPYDILGNNGVSHTHDSNHMIDDGSIINRIYDY